MKFSGAYAGSVLLFPSAQLSDNKSVKLGIIADLHQDIMHDGIERLSAFIKEMSHTNPDFIIRLEIFAI